MVEQHPPAASRRRHGTAPSPCRIHAATSGSARRPDGQIELLVVAHLRAHPQLDFSPYGLGRALGVSHGTVRRHLLRLAAAGQVIRTSLAPARFQIT
jgi:DNA-binding transcriptional ArsR family regulator